MSLLINSDVKNPLSPRNHHGIHLCRPESQPDATGFSGEPSGVQTTDSGHLVKESLEQAHASELETATAEFDSPLGGVTTPASSKKLQA
jgi:hypothetical protein